MEIASITALTILFLLFASLNMGSVMMPSSCWQPPSADKEPEVVFDFGSVQQIKEVYIFLADAKRTKFDILEGHHRTTGQFSHLMTMTLQSVCISAPGKELI